MCQKITVRYTGRITFTVKGSNPTEGEKWDKAVDEAWSEHKPKREGYVERIGYVIEGDQ